MILTFSVKFQAFDLLLQRIIELPEAHEKFFRKLLESLGQLYKFHRKFKIFSFRMIFEQNI